MICQLCGNDAGEGSRGPATGIIRPICPPCGKRVDGELEDLVERSRQMDTILDMVMNPPKMQELGEIT